MSFDSLGDGQGHLSWSRLWLEASSQPLQPSLTAAGGRGRPFCRRTPNPKIWEAAGGTVHIKGRRFDYLCLLPHPRVLILHALPLDALHDTRY